jgi:hypothetical protein
LVIIGIAIRKHADEDLEDSDTMMNTDSIQEKGSYKYLNGLG